MVYISQSEEKKIGVIANYELLPLRTITPAALGCNWKYSPHSLTVCTRCLCGNNWVSLPLVCCTLSAKRVLQVVYAFAVYSNRLFPFRFFAASWTWRLHHRDNKSFQVRPDIDLILDPIHYKLSIFFHRAFFRFPTGITSNQLSVNLAETFLHSLSGCYSTANLQFGDPYPWLLQS